MSILIRDMEMPKNCGACPLRASCIHRIYLERRPDYCPLVSVPPHYDLIDHNALKIAVMDCDCETRMDFLKHTMNCINNAPVVIPSDMLTYEAKEGE